VLPAIRAVEKSMMSVLTVTERRQMVDMLDKVLRRSAELAAEQPITLEARRNRPSRLG
jgi:hypothetical protein